MVAALAFGAQLEREKASQRARDALERKAAKGFNAGGACYGYDNVPVFAQSANGEQVKSHTDYRVNEEQAEVINGIFKAYAAGNSHTTIAKAMNGSASECGPKGERRRVTKADLKAVRALFFAGRTPPAPQRGKRGTGSWAPSAVREILYRRRYIGKVPFGSTESDRSDLRIVDDKLWGVVQQRLKEVAATYIRDSGHWWGRPSSERYLLTGLARCSGCGKSISVLTGMNGNGTKREKAHYYGCPYYRARGETVCENDHRARMEWLDGSVIEAIRRQVLKPEALAYVTEKAAELLERKLKEQPDRGRALDKEAGQLEKELERFMRLIADGKAPSSILEEVKRREERLRAVLAEQHQLAEGQRVLTPAKARELCGTRLKRFDALLLGDVPVARQALRKLLAEPLRVSPALVEGRRTLAFSGMTVLGPLFEPESHQVMAARSVVPKGLASPRGFEPRLPP